MGPESLGSFPPPRLRSGWRGYLSAARPGSRADQCANLEPNALLQPAFRNLRKRSHGNPRIGPPEGDLVRAEDGFEPKPNIFTPLLRLIAEGKQILKDIDASP